MCVFSFLGKLYFRFIINHYQISYRKQRVKAITSRKVLVKRLIQNLFFLAPHNLSYVSLFIFICVVLASFSLSSADSEIWQTCKEKDYCRQMQAMRKFGFSVLWIWFMLCCIVGVFFMFSKPLWYSWITSRRYCTAIK